MGLPIDSALKQTNPFKTPHVCPWWQLVLQSESKRFPLLGGTARIYVDARCFAGGLEG